MVSFLEHLLRNTVYLTWIQHNKESYRIQLLKRMIKHGKCADLLHVHILEIKAQVPELVTHFCLNSKVLFLNQYYEI